MSSSLEMLKKNVLITANMNDVSSFTKDIFIDFEPDDVVCRHIQYQTNDGKFSDPESKMGIIRTNLVNDMIGTFSAAAVSNRVNLTFQMNRKPVRGEYRFEIVDIDGSPMKRTGHIAIALEFVQNVNRKYAPKYKLVC